MWWGHSDVGKTLGHVGDITWSRINQLGSKDAVDTPLHLLPLQQGEDFFGGWKGMLVILSKSLTVDTTPVQSRAEVGITQLMIQEESEAGTDFC